MHRPVALLVAVAASLSALAQAGAQPRPPRDRAVVRDRSVDVQRQRRDGREEQTERTTRTLKVGANGEISLANISGHISIARGGGSEATLEIVKTASAPTVEEAREMLGLVQVDITERGGRAEVRTEYPPGGFRRENRRNFNISVDYTLTAPPGTRVTAHSVSGDITAKDIKGDMALESVSGSIRIFNGGRVAAAKSVSGSVEIADTQIDGQLEASSVSGNVVVRNVKAHGVEAGAVSGTVILQDVMSDRVEGHTVSGNVEFSGGLSRGGRYEISSHSGEVKVAVGGNTGFELEATSFSGDVRSDIALESRASDTGRRRQRMVRGVYGDGSAILEVTTFSGSIVISKR